MPTLTMWPQPRLQGYSIHDNRGDEDANFVISEQQDDRRGRRWAKSSLQQSANKKENPPLYL